MSFESADSFVNKIPVKNETEHIVVTADDAETIGSEEEEEGGDFEILTKTGLAEFNAFLVTEQDNKDSLDVGLDIKALDLPGDVEQSLRAVRLEYTDLMREVGESLDGESEDVPEEAVEAIHNQYLAYVEAQDRLAVLYTAYLENEPIKTESVPVEQTPVASTPEVTPDSAVVVEKNTSTEEASESSERTIEDTQSEAVAELKQTIEEEWEQIQYLHDSIHGSYSKEKRGPKEQAVMGELKGYFDQANNIRQKVSEVDTIYSTQPEAELERYQAIMSKLRDNTVAFVEEQSELYEAEKSTPGSAETSAIKESTIETPVDYTVAQAKVAELQTILDGHPALTPDEREAIAWSIDNLQQKITEQANGEKLEQAMTIADSLVITEVASPETEAIIKKATLLVKKAEHFSSKNDKEKETALAMALNLRTMLEHKAEGDDIADAKIKQAYQNLEDSMVDNEQSWVKVAGMSIPTAGPEGVLGARSFRDRLELAKRNHPDLKDSPEKQAVADTIIRLLFVVPEAGLTEEQVQRVTELAKELSVETNTVEARKTPVAEIKDAKQSLENSETESPEEEVENINEMSEDLDMQPSLRSKSLVIEADELDDGEVEITLAQNIEDELEEEDDSVVDAIEHLAKTPEGIAVIADMEQKDSINNSVPSQNEVQRSVKRETIEANTLTGKYLSSDPTVQIFFTEKNITPKYFESKLDAKIKQIDAKEIDFWESKFDKPFSSAFGYIKDMSLAEVETLYSLPTKERRASLTEANVKYEAFVTWMDTYDEMRDEVGSNPRMKFGELFAHWRLQKEMQSRR